MTVPWRFASMSGRQARVSRKVPLAQVSITLSHSDSGRSCTRWSLPTPLLLMSRSTGPSRSRIRAWPSRT